MSVVPASTHQTPTPGNIETCAATDPGLIARSVGLRYITDTAPGLTRKRAGKHFSYVGLDGKLIRDSKELERIKRIGIPPAWTNVWICPTDRGHILATGRDAKGRKQYRYHPRWREVRDETKYDKLIIFDTAGKLLTLRWIFRARLQRSVLRLWPDRQGSPLVFGGGMHTKRLGEDTGRNQW